MGMATIVAARAAGASTIIVTGTARDRFRLDHALRVGADHTIDVENDDAVDRVVRSRTDRWPMSSSMPHREAR